MLPASILSEIGDLEAQLEQLLAAPKRAFRDLRKQDIEDNAGIYAIYDAGSPLPIYVGVSGWATQKLADRIFIHKRGNLGGSYFCKVLHFTLSLHPSSEIKQYVYENCSVAWLGMTDRASALRLEHFAVAALNPGLNYVTLPRSSRTNLAAEAHS